MSTYTCDLVPVSSVSNSSGEERQTHKVKSYNNRQTKDVPELLTGPLRIKAFPQYKSYTLKQATCIEMINPQSHNAAAECHIFQ